ncbi:hypothetical protein BU16DRAFT_554032 [Lophium mytilinum]|uniref:Uncharacterized protein n=1 Tax=Lophium mytilinum TaxID=390894 RepID=A0A6A6RE19_9PEZI|nr:hypothetical protein BU16DRAFT_554032 [Lophium mytilinum]
MGDSCTTATSTGSHPIESASAAPAFLKTVATDPPPGGRLVDFFYETVQKSQWNINTALKKFVKDPVAFRGMLGQTSGIISGQFALEFHDRRSIGDRLDVFVYGEMGGIGNAEFMSLAIDREGYAVTHSYNHDEEHSAGTGEDNRYKTDVYQRPETDGRSICLQNTRETPIVDLLSKGRQCTLALANFITSTKIYAPFARQTFCERRAYLHGNLKEDPGEYLKSIAKAGCRLLGIRWKDLNNSTQLRKLTDGHSWCMDFDSTNVLAPATPSFVTDPTAFKYWATEIWDQNEHYYKVELSQISYPALQYVWAHFCTVDAFLNTALAMEVSVLPKNQWPDNGNTSLRDLIRNNQLLQSDQLDLGARYDDMMPEWLRDQEEECIKRCS